jgi:hypothetical protein
MSPLMTKFVISGDIFFDHPVEGKNQRWLSELLLGQNFC